MKTVQYGDWKIAVDIEKTKEYYKNYKLSTSQSNRNFQKYCETLSDEERSFFDSFGITPECCDVDPTIGVTKDKQAPCAGYYFVCGRYIEFPPENLISIEELAANNFVDKRPNTQIYIGAFKFIFQCDDYEIKNIPEDMPEGFICICFWCQNMRWLLREKPEKVFYYHPPKFWEIGRIIRSKATLVSETKKHHKNITETFESVFKECGIEYLKMKRKEIAKYKLEWVHEFTPDDADEYTKEEIKKVCITNKKYQTYLWHIFSWNFLKAEENAPRLFDETQKNECIIIFDYENIGYRLKNAENLLADAFNKMDYIDIIVTASDFSWTYCRTHELYIDPFYYRK